MDDKSTTLLTVAKRHPTQELASLEIQGRNIKINCRMSNLSQTGAFLEIINSNILPKQGDLVRMTVHLRQLNKMHVLVGQVIWCKGLGVGISFLKNKDLLRVTK